MLGSRPLRVPVGQDADRWRTFQAERILVVAARTVTSLVRVLECLPALLRGDSRVGVVFAYDPTSAFSDGVLDLLQTSGCRTMPWEQLASIPYDLLLTASENIEVPRGDGPVLVLPHGVGFQKHVPDSRSSRERLSGLVTDDLLASGRVWMAISHPDQERQLRSAQPRTAGRTVLVGDPCLDELRAGLRLQHAYRDGLGLEADQRLVVVSSTWGPTSLLGQNPALLAQLLAELPYDEYRVASIIHPNVWAAHGSWHLRNLLADALDAGLILVPPVHAWRGVLVAADLVIGDHGSVTLYGAALDKPVLLGAFGGDAVPGTAGAELSEVAPLLVSEKSLAEQVSTAVDAYVPGRFDAVTEHAFADPGRALARLRTAVYKLMKLTEPAGQPRLQAPPPTHSPKKQSRPGR